MTKSTKSNRKSKSHQKAKPYNGFPLTAHPSGQWCKKFQGKQYYFGPLDDWQGALERYERDWRYVIDGRTPPEFDTSNGCTIGDLCESFYESKKTKYESRDPSGARGLSADSLDGYYRTCKRLVDYFGPARRVDGLSPIDFEKFRAKLSQRLGVVALKNEINRCCMVFKYALDRELIDRPVKYKGGAFDKPNKIQMRRARNEAGRKDFTAEELRSILDAADTQLKAMVLLGINCGFGNTDCARLPQSAIDFEAGWVEFPRPKTEIKRRIPLWTETVAALQKAITERPAPKSNANADLCFLTIQGNRWVRTSPGKRNPDRFVTVNTLAKRYGKLLKELGINGNRGFYGLRHSFETQGGESKDQVAVNSLMGHSDGTMADPYREEISDERLRDVIDIVHDWLFAAE